MQGGAVTGVVPDWERACLSGASGLRPLVLDWPASDRAALDARARSGAVVVRAEGCKVSLLPACRAPGAYTYYPTAQKRQVENITRSEDLFAKLPVGAARLSAKLAQGASLRVALDVVGTWQTERGAFASPELAGDCAGATHVVTAITVGAFELDATRGHGAQAGAGVGTGGLGAEVGAQAAVTVERIASDGDDAACGASTANDTSPPSRCAASLRVALAPVAAELTTEVCPPGTRWDGKACAAKVDLSCPPGAEFQPGRGCVAARGVVPSASTILSIPAGDLVMGSRSYPVNEIPVHTVHVAAFGIDATEVTVDAYKACVDAGGCTPPSMGAACTYPFKRKHPINCVDWNQARVYCAFAGERLPSEEEWEYAARGPRPREFPWGDEVPYAFGPDPSGEKLCWKRMDPHSPDILGACPVASYPTDRSPFGVLDAGGNVAEWTASPYCAYADPRCAANERVLRGGFWATSTASDLRAAARGHALPTESSDRVGFRCAR